MSNLECIPIKLNYNRIINQEEKNNNKNSSKINSSKHIILFIIFINSFIFSESNPRNILSKISEIILKINGTGDINIFGDNFNLGEFDVYINGHLQNISTNIYYFENKTNYIKIISKDVISTTNYMFGSCYNIIEIDLSNFDTSEVSDMAYMFYGCSSLISLDLSNFDTSQVTDMNNMFYGCSSLISLDLSQFDTGQVIDMNSMFYQCTNLDYINLFLLYFHNHKTYKL